MGHRSCPGSALHNRHTLRQFHLKRLPSTHLLGHCKHNDHQSRHERLATFCKATINSMSSGASNPHQRHILRCVGLRCWRGPALYSSKWIWGKVRRSLWFRSIRPLSGFEDASVYFAKIDFSDDSIFDRHEQDNIRTNTALVQSLFGQSATRARGAPSSGRLSPCLWYFE